MLKSFSGIFFSLFIFLVIFGCAQGKFYPRIEHDDGYMKSLVLTGYGQNAYTTENINTYLNELEKLNANTASFLYSCLTKNLYSNNINCHSDYTPSLKSLSNAIHLAKSRGFRVSVRHYIDLSTKEWRCHWKPKNPNIAFKNLSNELESIAAFLEKRNVELFIFGAEYCQLTKPEYFSFWKEVISKIKHDFKGQITYGANWEKIEKSSEYEYVPFWNALDFIGIDHYRPIPKKIRGIEKKVFIKKTIISYAKLSKKLSKPLLITEIGFPGVKAGQEKPYEWRLKGKSDENEQADSYKYALQAIAETPNIKGVFIWRKLATDPKTMTEYNKDETGYTLWQRKAWHEIRDFFTNYGNIPYPASK